ncbi:MAG: putative alkylated repair protein [Acidimicrobiia bacterium]|nr:putative alkylated repair protein [Acidimicrobiia bacterium]
MTLDADPILPAVRTDAVFERTDLGNGSWVDVARGWLGGTDELYERFLNDVPWRQGRVFRYERYIDEPRVGAWFGAGSAAPHPVLLEAQRSLQHRYRARFDGFALAWYRDGRDSVAFHRDREMRWLEDTVIAVLTLGACRPWHLRPRANRYDHEAPLRGATHDFSPGGGDLIVMGGRCQADWEHAVPKTPGPAGRMSVQWRWTSRRGRPEIGTGYRAPRFFGKG